MKILVFWFEFLWKFVAKGPIDNESAIVQVMPWHWTVDKSSPEQMLTQFTDIYMWYKGEIS